MITMERKKEVFEYNKYAISAIYHIGNNVMLRQQLIKFIMHFKDCSESLAIGDIIGMEDAGLIKKDFFLKTNNYYLYLTKTSLAFLENKSSKNVSSYKVTEQRIVLSIYRSEYLLGQTFFHKLPPEKIVEKVESFSSTLFLGKGYDRNVYKLIASRFNNTLLDDDFVKDFKISTCNFVINRNKFLKNKQNPKDFYLKEKTIREKEIKDYLDAKKYDDVYRNYYNFVNMLSKNFFIGDIDFNPSDYEMHIDLGYWDILKTKDLYGVYKDIAFIYKMFERYFCIRHTDFSKNKFHITMDVNIYVGSEKRRNEFLSDSVKTVKDFITKFPKEYKKAKMALKETLNDDKVVHNTTIHFGNIDVDKYFQ